MARSYQVPSQLRATSSIPASPWLALTMSPCARSRVISPPEQFLLTTLIVKLAVMAVLATMLARYRRFRHILIFERRGWVDRLVFTLALGVPLMAGVAVARAPQLRRRRPDARGRVPRRADRRSRTPARWSACWSACPALIAGEFIALPFAVGCGFAGGGLREACPKEAIWQFTPFVFVDLPQARLADGAQARAQLADRPAARAGRARAAAAQRSARASARHRLFFLDSPSPLDDDALVVLATVLAVATPIKIWNSARIEHRLQEQEKLLLAAKIEALKSQINPHFLFNTLTSISSLIRSQPDTARMLIIKLSALLRRLLRSHEHFVTLREELESIDEYLDIEVVRFGPKLRVHKDIGPDTLDIVVPSMILQPLVENSIKHGLARKVGPGLDHDPQPRATTAAPSSRSRTTGWASCWIGSTSRCRAASGWPTCASGCASSTAPPTS